MEIWHHVAFNGDTKPRFKASIDNLAIEYKISPLPHHEIGLVSFDIAESHIHWPQITALIEEIGASDIYDTVFNEDEILAASWSRLVPVFEQGYPLPKEAWLSGSVPYGKRCAKCGLHKEKQQFNFRIKREPLLGKNSFMSLYWTYALFANPAVLAAFALQELKGYESWPVLIHKTGQPVQSIAQVYLPHIAQASLVPEETLGRNSCPECGTIKYLPHMRGYMQFTPELLQSNLDFLLSQEWFGDGHTAYREILISNRVARLSLENKWQGVRLKPVKVVSAS